MTSWAHDFLLGIPMMGGENTKKCEFTDKRVSRMNIVGNGIKL